MHSMTVDELISLRIAGARTKTCITMRIVSNSRDYAQINAPKEAAALSAPQTSTDKALSEQNEPRTVS